MEPKEAGGLRESISGKVTAGAKALGPQRTE